MLPKPTRKKSPAVSPAQPASLAAPITFPDAIAALPAPATTRVRILHAAMEILNDDGFGALTQTKVAKKAGVRQSHITYYFPARNDLLRETASYGCNAMLEIMADSIDAGTLTLKTARSIFVADLSDRRFARLICALVVASDEDDQIKTWLASFEVTNRERLLAMFLKLGLKINMADIELFHAAYVGSVILDLGDSTPESLDRSTRILQRAFDQILAKGLDEKPPSASRSKATTAKNLSARKTK